MDKKSARKLIRKYLSGTCSPEEQAIVESWYLREVAGKEDLPGEPDYEGLEKEIRARLMERTLPAGRVNRIWYRRVAAVLVFVLLGTAVYWYFRQGNAEVQQPVAVSNDLPPGGDKAILTLTDGTKIYLDDADEGEIAEEEGMAIRKTADGQVVYESGTQEMPGPGGDAWNTVETPPGGQYRVSLPDGTRVWLNASSSLRYPVRFTGPVRQVELTGEGYFEVTASREAPFIVTTPGQEVEVLGTHFNINAYEDEEAAKTTLLEGSVKISAEADSPALLYPGQQASLEQDGSLRVREVDTEMAVAWKNGLFKFKRASVETVMRQLARWYDVEVVYEGEIPEKVFTGEIYRNLNASQVLDILRYTNLDFRIESRKIIVSDP